MCSLRRPVCVQSATVGNHGPELLLLERALEEVVYGWDLPDSFADFERPLVWSLDAEKRLSVELNSVFARGFDRAAPHCVGGDATLETARRCVLEATLGARAPATAPWLRGGFAAASVRELGDAPRTDAEMRSSFANPQAGVLTSSEEALVRPEGAVAWVSTLRSARMFRYLSERADQSATTAGYLSLTLAATETPAGALRFLAEPDLADVFRATHSHDRNEVARFYADFAKWSYFDADKQALTLSIDWEIEGSTLPRSVAFRAPLEPTGSVYALLSLPDSMRHEVIGFRTSCETPVSYVWSVTRLDAENREISTFPLTFQERASSAAGRVLPDPSMVKLLAIGTNLGGVALTHPFDPDHGPHEAHGCRLAIDVVPAAAP